MAPYLGESLAGCSVEHVVSRTVRDSAAALDASAGPAPGDPYMAPPPLRAFLEDVHTEPRPLRIALTTEAFSDAPVHQDCIDAATKAAKLCEELGHHVELAAPSFDAEGLDKDYQRLFAVGAAANIRQRAKSLDKALVPDEFERVTWAMMALADELSATDYVQLINRLHATCRQIGAFFETFDLLLTPTLAQPPVPLGHLDMMMDDLDAFSDRLATDNFTTVVGHFDGMGGGRPGVNAWNSEHDTGGCDDNSISTPGRGLFYCFAE
jgi:Asp-tRNA(Asn)/Glu-tRNA(Gln) amidotransferase A subunit family amidase